MNTFIIRVELHHDEQASDYTELHDMLHTMGIYRVVWNEYTKTWYDLPAATYLFSDTDANLTRCLTTLEKLIEHLLREHKKYPEIALPNQYSLVVCEVARDENEKIKVMGGLQKTTDTTKLPPGKVL